MKILEKIKKNEKNKDEPGKASGTFDKTQKNQKNKDFKDMGGGGIPT